MLENQNLTEVWERVFTAYPILRKKGELTVKSEDVTELINLISPEDKPLATVIEEMIFNKILQHMTQNVAPEFWKHFSNRENELDGFNKFKDATCNLYACLSEYLSLIENIELLRKHVKNEGRVVYGEKTAMESFKVTVRGTLHSQLQVNYQIILEDFYNISFKVFCNSDKSKKDNLNKTDHDESTEDLIQCGGCGHEMEQCRCKYIIQVFHDTNRKLIELELLERLAGNVITQLIRKRIESHVQETCKGSFDTSYLNSLDVWLDTVVMRWLHEVYSAGSATPFNMNAPQVVGKFRHKLLYFLYETYTRTRIDQLFNIIIEYPDSQPAVEDLRQCLQRTDLRGYLTRRLQRALETRLLHPGVNTPDVLTAYVAAIRALRQLDPSGVLLETVTKPVRQYLRYRDDTVRCVVSSLTDEGPSELADELVRGEALQLDEGVPSEEKMDNWEKWNPTPIHADPSRLSKRHRTSDIISMLVNVYGSKEVFVNEYRNLLADRLLSQFNYSTDKEIRNLELLKLRFGESQLHYCEVMLKDVNDSKRINAHLHSDTNFSFDSQTFPSTAMILSAQFWPPFKEDTLELPSFVKEHLQVYTKAFETLKGNRTLNWKPHLGCANLDIELKDRKLNLIVSPIHATIIWHFQTKSEWMVDELSHVMQVPPTVLRRKIAYWQSQGLLREVATDQFLLVEENSPRSKGPPSTEMVCDDEESESAMASAHDQREEELQVFWSYIVGMLTNLDSMPLERIHQMLKMFASQGPTAVECSLQELRQFLDRKVKEHKLVLSSGFYRLPKA